jgi:hypothetical protein
MTVSAASGEQLSYNFSVRWRAEGNRRTRGELRQTGRRDEPGAVVGHVTVNWRRFTDGLGVARPAGQLFALSARLLQGRDPDPVTTVDEIEIEIDRVATGEPISLRTTTVKDWFDHSWALSGPPTEWWTRIVVNRDGLPAPAELGEV